LGATRAGRRGAFVIDLPEAIETIRPSILQVRVEPPRESGPGHHGAVVGTAFLVDPAAHAITAGHVATAAEEHAAQTGGDVTVGLAIPNIETSGLSFRASFQIIDCEVAQVDSRNDLALLKLRQNPFESGRASGMTVSPMVTEVNALFGKATLQGARPHDGERVGVSGYPLAEPVLITTSGGIATSWGSNKVEIQPPEAPSSFTIPDIKDVYLADVAVNPGNSGGPVYRVDTAEVIGVCTAFRIAEGDAGGDIGRFAYNSGLCLVTPIMYGIELLQQHLGSD
jgi:S1-C subfamily serine protease